MKSTYDTFTAAVVQPEVIQVRDRKEIQKNLERALHVLSSAKAVSVTPKVKGSKIDYEEWAPMKLVVFPECFLQGPCSHLPVDKIVRDIAIEIPGEETELLAKSAIENAIYLSGVALEVMPQFPGHYFNCNFIIDPEGKVIHKYHKYTPAIHFELCTSPHDVFDQYYEIFGQGKSYLQTFFPVVDTPIGKIGTLIAMDGHFPESWRALALNGAEIIICSGLSEPVTSPPRDWWELEARTNAICNMVYVIRPRTGLIISERHVKCSEPGDVMIVDPEGVIIARCPYPGESMTSAVIRLDHLRRRRMDPSRNFISYLRTEVYQEMYQEIIYPKNLYIDKEKCVRSPSEVYKRDPHYLKIINQLVERGVYTKPLGK